MTPLIVNLRHLADKDLQLKGEISPEELDLNGLDPLIHAPEPVRYDLEIQKLGQSLLVRGRISVSLRCECVRCLKSFPLPLELKEFGLALPLEGEEAVGLTGDCVDLTPYLREDIVLGFPQHPLCEPGCAGLKQPSAGDDAQSGGESQTTSSAWAVLNKLKLRN